MRRAAYVVAGVCVVAATACGPRRPAATRDPLAGEVTIAWPDPEAADGAIGADATLFVTRVAADGRWVLLCQSQDTDGDGARHSYFFGHEGTHGGDRMLPAVVLGSGEGLVIDAPIAVSPDERWLVVWRTGGLQLVDTRARSITELAALLSTEREEPPVAAAFSADGAWLAWSLAGTLTLRELATGAQREVELGGRIWALAATHAGWIRADVTRRDTDGDGVVTARLALSSTYYGPCTHAWDGETFAPRGDEPDPVWVELATGATRPTAPAAPLVEAPVVEPRATGDDPRVLAIDASGRELVATEPAGDATPPRGPLRWRAR